MPWYYYLIIVVVILVILLVLVFLSKILKKKKRTTIYNEEKDLIKKNDNLYQSLIEELDRTKKISKNEESINLYSSWLSEFESISEKKVIIDSVFSDLEKYFNEDNHKLFISTFEDYEGRKFKFYDDLKSLYQKVKQYTEYELDNTRISLTLKTELRDLSTQFENNLAEFEIFNKSFNTELEIAFEQINTFETLQREGDYPEGRNVLKKCNRTKNKINYCLDVLLEFYTYLNDLDLDIHIMNQISTEINELGFSINIDDFDERINSFIQMKEDVVQSVISITFNEEISKEFVENIKTEIDHIDSSINELKETLEEKFSFIKEIMIVLDKNEELFKITNELVEGANQEIDLISKLYDLTQSVQIKDLNDDIATFELFKEDYDKLLEIAHKAKEDYSKIKQRVSQSNTYLTHLISNLKNSINNLKEIRSDELQASENIELYNSTLVEIDLFLRKNDHHNKLSRNEADSLIDIKNKITDLENELNMEPLNITNVRNIDKSLHKIISNLLTKSLEQDIKRRLGCKLLINYCSLYNHSDELNLTIKKLYSEYNKNEYNRVLKDTLELLNAMSSDGKAIFEEIVGKVEDIKFSDSYPNTIAKFNS